MKNLERKVAGISLELKAGQDVGRQQQEEITGLQERLARALKVRVSMQYCCTRAQYIDGIYSQHVIFCAPQETATRESLSKARELQLENKINLLEANTSVLESKVDKLEKQIVQLEVFYPIEQLVKVCTLMWLSHLLYSVCSLLLTALE